ncbi:hypothetical protein DTO271G3_6337 [Paecilomyces variotii]|nr:hypothetical protein DTO271G3_6337 [Paecilomyces variotii]
MMLPSRSLVAIFQFLLLASSPLVRAGSDTSKNDKLSKPCTVQSPTSGMYFDLNAISLSPPEKKDGRKLHKDDRDESWLAKGHDYPANFTINICAPVIENISDVVGVDKSKWRNVSAYYEQNGKIYSIGQQASEPIFRGRKLILNYTDGSPCPSSSAFDSRNILDGDKGPDYNNLKSYDKDVRRKSTIMSFLCDREPMAPRAAVSFVGTMDHCTYFFEVRSPAACGGVAYAPNGGLGPAGVFGVIVLIAIAAYLVGGCAYQRTVMHQRGWRQCPNYSLWAGMFGFISVSIRSLMLFATSLFRPKRSRKGRFKNLNSPSLPVSRLD